MRSFSSLAHQPLRHAPACRPARRRRTPAAPAPMAPTAAPSTSTCARATRCTSAITAGPVRVVEMRFHVHRQQLDGGAQARHRAHQRLLDRGAHRGGAAQASSRRACACAGRRSGAGRRGAWSTWSKRIAWWRKPSSVGRSRRAPAAPAPGPSGRRPSARPATRLRAGCSAPRRWPPPGRATASRWPATASRPSTTPAEVQTSVNRWRASPSSAIERCSRALRSIAQASAPFMRRADDCSGPGPSPGFPAAAAPRSAAPRPR